MSEKIVAVFEIAVLEPEFKAVEYIEAASFAEAKKYGKAKYGVDTLVEFCTKRKITGDPELPRTVEKPDLRVDTLGSYIRAGL